MGSSEELPTLYALTQTSNLAAHYTRFFLR
jgi:hypothetical protein